jgi:hypothetical protein
MSTSKLLDEKRRVYRVELFPPERPNAPTRTPMPSLAMHAKTGTRVHVPALDGYASNADAAIHGYEGYNGITGTEGEFVVAELPEGEAPHLNSMTGKPLDYDAEAAKRRANMELEKQRARERKERLDSGIPEGLLGVKG